MVGKLAPANGLAGGGSGNGTVAVEVEGGAVLLRAELEGRRRQKGGGDPIRERADQRTSQLDRWGKRSQN